MYLVEKTKAHVIVRLFFGFGFLGSGSWGGSGSSKLGWIGQELFQHFSLLEGDVGPGSDGQQVLHAVDDRVRHRSDGWVTDGQRHGGNISDATQDALLQVLVPC